MEEDNCESCPHVIESYNRYFCDRYILPLLKNKMGLPRQCYDCSLADWWQRCKEELIKKAELKLQKKC